FSRGRSVHSENARSSLHPPDLLIALKEDHSMLVNRRRDTRATSLLRRLREQNTPQGVALENLEERRVLALLGVTLTQLPLQFYNSTGKLNYEASSHEFDVTATPTAVFLPSGPKVIVAGDGDFQLHLRVDNAGNLLGGVNAGDPANLGAVDANGDDLIV